MLADQILCFIISTLTKLTTSVW